METEAVVGELTISLHFFQHDFSSQALQCYLRSFYLGHWDGLDKQYFEYHQHWISNFTSYFELNNKIFSGTKVTKGESKQIKLRKNRFKMQHEKNWQSREDILRGILRFNEEEPTNTTWILSSLSKYAHIYAERGTKKSTQK